MVPDRKVPVARKPTGGQGFALTEKRRIPPELLRDGDEVYVGTSGVDGIDSLLAANPHPYQTGDSPGPPSFSNSFTTSSTKPVGFQRTVGDQGLRIFGEPSAGTDGTVVFTLPSRFRLTKRAWFPSERADTGAAGTFRADTNGDVTWLDTAGADGQDGLDGGAITIPFTFSTTTTVGDPGSGFMRFNNATQGFTTTVVVDNNNLHGQDVTAIYGSIDDTNRHGQQIGNLRVVKKGDETKFYEFSVVSMAQGSGYWTLTVVRNGEGSGSNQFANNDDVLFMFTPAGKDGFGGAITLRYLFDPDTSNGNPDPGYFRLDDSDPALAAQMFISVNGYPYPNGGDWQNVFANALSESTSVILGQIRIFGYDQPDGNFAIYDLMHVTAHVGYSALDVVYLGGSFTTTDLGDQLIFTFIPKGDAGDNNGLTYTFDDTTTDSDPGDGNLRLSASTQNSSTTIRADLKDAFGNTWTSVLDTFDDSSSTVKGQILLKNAGDSTKWLTFNVTAVASPSGYRNITVANTGSSASSPFVDGDTLQLYFARTGDKGDAGAAANVATDTIWDAKGDLAAATGADAAVAVPVGADGYVLTADSGESAGVKWAATGTGGGGSGSQTTFAAGASQSYSDPGSSFATIEVVCIGAGGGGGGGPSAVSTAKGGGTGGGGGCVTRAIFRRSDLTFPVTVNVAAGTAGGTGGAAGAGASGGNSTDAGTTNFGPYLIAGGGGKGIGGIAGNSVGGGGGGSVTSATGGSAGTPASTVTGLSGQGTVASSGVNGAAADWGGGSGGGSTTSAARNGGDSINGGPAGASGGFVTVGNVGNNGGSGGGNQLYSNGGAANGGTGGSSPQVGGGTHNSFTGPYCGPGGGGGGGGSAGHGGGDGGPGGIGAGGGGGGAGSNSAGSNNKGGDGGTGGDGRVIVIAY